jgi:hypothetical protein
MANRLTVSKTGNGGGSVRSIAGGIDCGGSCSTSYTFPTHTVLAAEPASGSRFVGWSGDGDDMPGNRRHVYVSGNKNVTAQFDVGQQVPVDLRPDLVVETLRASGLLTISFHVKNIGGTPSAATSVKVFVQHSLAVFIPPIHPLLLPIENEPPRSFDVISLPPGLSESFTLTDTVPPPPLPPDNQNQLIRMVRIAVVVDPDSKVTESSDSNNTALLSGSLRNSGFQAL